MTDVQLEFIICKIIMIVADLQKNVCKEINLWIRDSQKKSSFTYWATINLKDSTVFCQHVFWKLIFPWFINNLSFESCLLCTGLLHRLFSFVKNTLDRQMIGVTYYKPVSLWFYMLKHTALHAVLTHHMQQLSMYNFIEIKNNADNRMSIN